MLCGTVNENTMTSPQTFQCTAFSAYRGSVIEEQRHTTVGSERADPPVQILLCGGRSGLAWGINGKEALGSPGKAKINANEHPSNSLKSWSYVTPNDSF